MSDVPSELPLIAYRGDGLGTRIYNMLLSWRAARKVNARTIVFWPGTPGDMTGYFGHDFRVSNLFDLLRMYTSGMDREIIFIDGVPPHDIVFDRIDKRPKWRTYSQKGWPPKRLLNTETYTSYNGYYPLPFAGEDFHSNMRECRELFLSLPLNPIIANAVREVEKTVDLSRVVGIHFRRGDIAGNLRDYGTAAKKTKSISPKLDQWASYYFRKCAPVPAYCRAARAHIRPDSKLLVFSDDTAARTKFATEVADDMLLDFSHLTKGMLPIQAALFEMLIMSRCAIILTTNSGFSQTASMIGGKDIEFVKKWSSVEEFVREFSVIAGFDKLRTDDPLLDQVADMLINNSRFNVVREELGWIVDAEALKRMLLAEG